MRTRLTLRPGDRGTKKLVERYGSRLVCVRYRYDEDTGRRIKTVEWILDETLDPSIYPPIQPYEPRLISVGFHEVELREQVKAAGGRWHPEAVAGSLPYERIVSLGLTERMMESAIPFTFEKNGNMQM